MAEDTKTQGTKGRLLEAISKVDAPAGLVKAPLESVDVPKRPGSLMSQARQIADILREQEQMIAGAEMRVFGLQNDAPAFSPPDDAALGIRLRYLAEHAAANCERFESLLKAL